MAQPFARAWAISAWLSEKGVYSLRSQHSGSNDPTASFLFGDRTGYCVHFAHAATYLMRSAGVPARVATGYAIDEASRQGGSAILITGNASHAWPETYLEGYGWVVVDVSPQTVLTPPPPPPDADLQRLLGELVRGMQPVPVQGRPLPGMEDFVFAFSTAFRLFLLGALLSLVGLMLVKVWRRISPLVLSSSELPRLAYRAELDRLSELKLRRRYGESREAFASRVADVAPSFVTLTREHVRHAFGSASEADFRPLSTAMHGEMRRAFPWWRILLGVLNPFSWLLSR